MRRDDAIFGSFLRSALRIASHMSFSDDDTCIPETAFCDDGDDLSAGVVPESFLPLPSQRRNARGGSAAGGSAGRRPAAACAARAPLSAVQMVNEVLGDAPAPAPALLATGDLLPAGPLRTLYPFIKRAYNDDMDAFAVIEWTKCSAANVWAIITSTNLSMGASKSMSFVLNFAIRNQLTGALKHFLGPT